MRIVASYNIKGGVGKTAAAVNLAYLAAHGGARTLVWDLDPQGAASFYFRVKPKVKGGGQGLLQRKRPLETLLKGTDFPNLDLLPADFSYRHMDLVLGDTKKPTRRLRKLLKPLEDRYDWVFLDCPPSISLVSENVFRAADALLVPLIPTTLSLRTYDQLLGFLAESGAGVPSVLAFFSMVDRRKRLHQQIMQALPGERPGILASAIPYSAEVERMGIRRAPLPCFAGASEPARAYRALWRELAGRL